MNFDMAALNEKRVRDFNAGNHSSLPWLSSSMVDFGMMTQRSESMADLQKLRHSWGYRTLDLGMAADQSVCFL